VCCICARFSFERKIGDKGQPHHEKHHEKPDYASLSDEELVSLCANGSLPTHNLEKTLGNLSRAVSIRRQWLGV
jgi:hypothetical protein